MEPVWISKSAIPPGTSKWNKIEYRLFSFISQNWRGKPLFFEHGAPARDGAASLE